jgi:tetratricopeptide (TPR) repeat protein
MRIVMAVAKRRVLSPLLALTLVVGLTPAATALSLNDQLQIPLNNGTQGTQREMADQLLQLGIQQDEAGNSMQAIATWQKALPLYRQVQDVVAEGNIYQRLGQVYEKLGLSQEAEEAYRNHLAIARDHNDFQGQISGFNRVGMFLLQRNYVSEAEKAFQQALKLAQDLRDSKGLGVCWSNLGLVAHYQGRYPEAIKRYQLAQQFDQRVDADPRQVAQTQNRLGDAYMAVSNYQQAAIAYRKALFFAGNAQSVPDQFQALTGAVLSAQGLGQTGLALESLNRRLTLATTVANDLETVKSLHLFAEYYRLQGNVKAADSYYQQAIVVAQKVNATREAALLTNQQTTLRVINQNKLSR